MNFKVVIPARWGSTRLPGKPLLDLAGRPLLAWVWEVARESGAAQVVIATDDQRIHDTAVAFGAEVCLTSSDHPSGTDRIHEVVTVLGWDDADIIVNLQGDEPLVPPELVRQVAEVVVNDAEAGMATLATPVTGLDEALNPNIVKLVCDMRGRALYFSRAPIPFVRSGAERDIGSQLRHDMMLRHIGLYAYRVGALKRIAALPPAPYEEIEQLEQLRALHHGIPIAVDIACAIPPAGVDTAADLERVRNLMGE